MEKYQAIGVFDSGVGGLTVASEISKTLPSEKIIYFGDTAHVPYGEKTEDQIIGYVFKIMDFLRTLNVKALVMACNTSSAIVLPLIKGKTDIPVLGVIEFASRMALKVSPNERIGVVANPVTVRSKAYVREIKGISMNGVYVAQSACPRWVPLIEAGQLSGEEVEKVVREDVQPLVDQGIDSLILGCTHYPYLTPIIRKITGNDIKIINPAHALVEKLQEVLEANDMLSDAKDPRHEFYVSGDPEDFKNKGSFFFGQEIEKVEKVDLERLSVIEV